jgi:hypothetical protein
MATLPNVTVADTTSLPITPTVSQSPTIAGTGTPFYNTTTGEQKSNFLDDNY